MRSTAKLLQMKMRILRARDLLLYYGIISPLFFSAFSYYFSNPKDSEKGICDKMP